MVKLVKNEFTWIANVFGKHAVDICLFVGLKLGNAVGLEGGGVLGAGGVALELVRGRNEVFGDIKVLLFGWRELGGHGWLVVPAAVVFVLLADLLDGGLEHLLGQVAGVGVSASSLSRRLLSPSSLLHPSFPS